MPVEARTSVSHVLAVALCAAGCAVPTSSWLELRSQHFVLQTDAGVTRGEELVRDFERSYAAVRACVKPAGASEPPGVTHVVAFGEESDFEKVAPPGYGGYFMPRHNPIESYSVIVIPANAARRTRTVEELVQHELAHRFVVHYMPSVPVWLNEGLATFLGTARLEDDGVVMGEPPSHHWLSASGWMVDRHPLVRIATEPAEVRSFTSGLLPGRQYLGAWMLVHVMVLSEPRYRQALEGYMSDLRSNDSSSEESFSRHFDAKTLSEIDTAYLAFQTRTSNSMQTIPLDAQPTFEVVSRRPMSEVETIALVGRLWRPEEQRQMLAIEDANRAIASDSKSPEGYLLRASVLFDPKTSGAAVGDLRTALRHAPDDPRVRRGLAAALLSQEGPTTEVKGLVEWVRERARVADDYRLLARWELATKHPEQALEFARRGVSLDVACLSCYELAAEASFRGRDYDGAIRWQRQAVNLAAEHVSKGSLDRLARFERAKKAPPAPTPKPKLDDEAQAVHDAMKARRPEFDACYEEGLARNATLRGKVVVRFTLGADGSVTASNDGGSEIGDAGVVRCVVELVRTMKFAPPKKGARGASLVIVFPKTAGSDSQAKPNSPPP